MKKIDSLNNFLIKETKKLLMKKNIILNKKYLIEGRNVIEEAYKANVIEKIFLTDKNLFENVDVEKILVTEEIIKKLSSKNTNIGAVAICKIVDIEFELNSFKKIIVLDSISNPSNFGNIIRTAKGLGYEAVITFSNSVFKWNQSVISGSQGAIFNFPVIQIKKYNHSLKHKPYYFMLKNDSKKINDKFNVEEKYALVFGNESTGISKELINSWKGESVYIPINDIESLSVTSAAAIAMFKLKGE